MRIEQRGEGTGSVTRIESERGARGRCAARGEPLLRVGRTHPLLFFGRRGEATARGRAAPQGHPLLEAACQRQLAREGRGAGKVGE